MERRWSPKTFQRLLFEFVRTNLPKPLPRFYQDETSSFRPIDLAGLRLRAKGGRTVIYSGDGLQAAVEACIRSRPKVRSMYLIATRRGRQYTTDGFRCVWQYAMTKYLESGGERFTEHDLRAKVASDSEDLATAQGRLQHQSASTTNKVYRRAPVKVAVLKKPCVPKCELGNCYAICSEMGTGALVQGHDCATFVITIVDQRC